MKNPEKEYTEAALAKEMESVRILDYWRWFDNNNSYTRTMNPYVAPNERDIRQTALDNLAEQQAEEDRQNRLEDQMLDNRDRNAKKKYAAAQAAAAAAAANQSWTTSFWNKIYGVPTPQNVPTPQEQTRGDVPIRKTIRKTRTPRREGGYRKSRRSRTPKRVQKRKQTRRHRHRR